MGGRGEDGAEKEVACGRPKPGLLAIVSFCSIVRVIHGLRGRWTGLFHTSVKRVSRGSFGQHSALQPADWLSGCVQRLQYYLGEIEVYGYYYFQESNIKRRSRQ